MRQDTSTADLHFTVALPSRFELRLFRYRTPVSWQTDGLAGRGRVLRCRVGVGSIGQSSRDMASPSYVAVEGISLRARWGDVETSGRREGVIDGAVRTRAGQSLGGVGQRPTWRVCWQDGPTREALMTGRPRWAGTGWVRRGRRGPAVRPRRFRRGGRVGVAGAGEPGVAELLRRVGHGDIAEMGSAARPGRPHPSRRPTRWSRVWT